MIFLIISFHYSLLAKSGFEYYGDIAQFLPVVMIGYSLCQDDTQGIKEQAIGSLVTFGITTGVKATFEAISKNHPEKAKISQRPQNGSYHGFPSGHTSFAFSAVGFAHKRYGYEVSLPMFALASAVGVSRVHAKKHTAVQVIAGAALGAVTSYLIASEHKMLSHVSLYTSSAADGSMNYHAGFAMRF